MKRILVVVAGLLGLAGCGGILPKPSPSPALYRLTAATDFPSAAPAAAPVQLVIAMPLAEAGLDSTRIALARSATTLDYFADAAWTDRLPVLLRARLVETFENAHRVAAAAEPSDLHADDVLVLDVRHFEAAYDGVGAPHWRIEIGAKLIALPDRKLIAAQAFRGETEAPRNDMSVIVETADQDWRGVAKQIADWAGAALAQPRPR